jgi:hypothetical protein
MFYIIAIITHFYLNWQPYGELLFYVAVWLCAVALYLELRSILKQKIKKNSEIAISLVVTAIVAIHALAFLLLILFSFFVFKMITRQGCINAYHVWRKKLAEKVVGSDFSMHSKGYN